MLAQIATAIVLTACAADDEILFPPIPGIAVERITKELEERGFSTLPPEQMKTSKRWRWTKKIKGGDVEIDVDVEATGKDEKSLEIIRCDIKGNDKDEIRSAGSILFPELSRLSVPSTQKSRAEKWAKAISGKTEKKNFAGVWCKANSAPTGLIVWMSISMREN